MPFPFSGGMPMGLADSGASDVISLTACTSVTDTVAGGTALASLMLKADGTIWQHQDNGGPTDLQLGNWSTPHPPGGSYWVRWTNTTGTINVGTAGTWQALSSDRSWGCTRGATGTKQATGTLEVATDAAGTNIVATKTGLTMTATVT